MSASRLFSVGLFSVGLFVALISVSWWMRSPSFEVSVIDHDESTYLVISEALSRGARLYIDVWDTKPAGVFLMLGAALKLCGEALGGVLTTRALAALLVACTGWLLYKSKRAWGCHEGESALSGLLWVVMTSSPLFGLSAHIELFFMVWVALGLALLSVSRESLSLSLGAGFALGLGFITKYVALFDAFAFGVALIGVPLMRALSRRDRALFTLQARRALLYIVGGLTPFACLHLYFWLAGDFSAFYEVTYEVPRRYVSHGSPEIAWRMFTRFHTTYPWISTLCYLSLIWGLIRRDRSAVLLNGLWCLGVWCAVLIPGKPFTHYYLHLCAPVACLAPRALLYLSQITSAWLNRRSQDSTGSLMTSIARHQATIILSLSALIMLGYAQQQRERHERHFARRLDPPRVAARYLKPRLNAGDVVYTANFDHILYHLLGLSSPTPYVHRSLLTNPQHLKTLRLDPRAELDRILEKRPRFILTVGPYRHAHLRAALKRDYRRVKVFGRRYWIYERVTP